MRYLGIDYGERRVGLALSDEAGSMGFPHAILPATPALLEELVRLVEAQGVGAIVIGESVDYAGAHNRVAIGAHALGDALAARTGRPVAYEDERLTSAAARRQHEPVAKSRKPAQHAAVDASAAALILTSYLERHAR